MGAAERARARSVFLFPNLMTKSPAILLRDIFITRVIVPISLGELHNYRIEVYSDESSSASTAWWLTTAFPQGLILPQCLRHMGRRISS